MLRFSCTELQLVEAAPKVLQEECSTQSARSSHFRAAPAHNQERSLTIPATHQPLSRFGTGPHLPITPRKLEIYITRMFSATSQFLIDNFVPFSRYHLSSAAPVNSFGYFLSRPPLFNRAYEKLEILLSATNKRRKYFLIDNFSPVSRLCSLPLASTPSPLSRNPLASPYVLNDILGGCNLPCRP